MSNIPELRFKEFSGEWEEKKGNLVFQAISNKNHNSDLPILAISQEYGAIPRDMINYKISVTNNSVRSYKVVEIGDFIISLRSFQGGIEYSNYKGICSPAYIILRNIIDIDKIFFKYFFKTYKYIQKLNSKLEGIRDGKMISYKYFSEIKLPLPLKQEQQKIASFLTTIDTKIEQLTKKVELQEQYKKGVMQKIFSEEIRFKKDDGSEFPEWEKKKLKDVLFEHKTRNSDNNIKEVFSVAKTKGVINQIEHLGRSYAATDLTNYKIVFPHDIVYTKSPTSDFPYGIIKQNRLNRKGVVSTLYAVFAPTNQYIGSLIDYYFSSWVNTYNYLNPLVHKGAKNTMNINNSDFLNGAKIPMPTSEKEQIKITNFLTSLDKQIDSTKAQLVQTKEFKKGLLQRMFV